MVHKPIKSIENDPQNASLKAISTLEKNYPQQPPAKLEVTKNVVGKLIKFIWNNPKTHLFKAFGQLEKKLTKSWCYKLVSFHDIAIFSENYALI